MRSVADRLGHPRRGSPSGRVRRCFTSSLSAGLRPQLGEVADRTARREPVASRRTPGRGRARATHSTANDASGGRPRSRLDQPQPGRPGRCRCTSRTSSRPTSTTAAPLETIARPCCPTIGQQVVHPADRPGGHDHDRDAAAVERRPARRGSGRRREPSLRTQGAVEVGGDQPRRRSPAAGGRSTSSPVVVAAAQLGEAAPGEHPEAGGVVGLDAGPEPDAEPVGLGDERRERLGGDPLPAHLRRPGRSRPRSRRPRAARSSRSCRRPGGRARRGAAPTRLAGADHRRRRRRRRGAGTTGATAPAAARPACRRRRPA